MPRRKTSEAPVEPETTTPAAPEEPATAAPAEPTVAEPPKKRSTRRVKAEEPTAPPTEPAPAAPEEPKAPEAPAATAWKVIGPRGYIRTYTIADHGSDAAALAAQFAVKVGGRVKAE